MKIAFDVMGSDHGSLPAIAAALEVIKEFKEVEFFLVGNEKEINGNLQILLKNKPLSPRITILATSQVITMNDGPLAGIRMSNSSMSQAIQLVKNKKADGILTSGSTAAYLGACHFLLGEIKGIKRPAFMPIMPTLIKDRQVVLLDVGANIENTVDELINFALMGHIYSQTIQNISRPKIGLLNIGIEENKGPEVTKATYAKLKQLTQKNEKLNFLNFHGNIEPRNVLNGEVDIIVCDGYSGNLVLKSVEGMASLLFTLIKNGYKKNLWTKFLALISVGIFKNIKKTFDYKNTGGAQLIGINGIAFKAHGSSDKKSYYSTLKLLIRAIEQDVTNKIAKQIQEL
ncbi:phosphate acyltransferase PlsX [Spiroplasma endosymbiont of Polydrusus pterygomalis]|uniref:phosphate acyltransferase PlsX n=1 Tax=Spiroplasma endosymbiont of Polydrusus pterygomalis TaxID=3139327 RepID=UPI003CCA9AA1